MGKIILEIDEYHSPRAEFRIFTQESITIGRGFDNDVIIRDPFVSEFQLLLSLTQDGWMCEDKGSLNGSFVISKSAEGIKTYIDRPYLICSGDTFIIGKTSIRLWESNHSIGPTQMLEKRVSFSLFEPSKAMQHLFLTLIAFYIINYLQAPQWSWKSEISPLLIVAQVTFLLFILGLWAGFWAMITRFSKRQHRFRQHLTFACQWVILMMLASLILKYISFLVCNSSFSLIIGLLFFSLSGAYILNEHLSISTHLSLKKRVIIAGSIVFLVALMILLSYYGQRNEFNPNPSHSISIVPMPQQLIPHISIDNEIRKINDIF